MKTATLEPDGANAKLGLPYDRMSKVIIAFDVDGTLRNNVEDRALPGVPQANEDIRTLLIILSKFKNTKILVWSGGGELYARQMAINLAVSQYVDMYASKSDYEDIRAMGKVIAIDDIQDTAIGDINLIVREK